MADLWEWQWEDIARREMKRLPREAKAPILAVMEMVRDPELRRDAERLRRIKKLKGKVMLWEIRVNAGNSWFRLFFTKVGDKRLLVAVAATQKADARLPSATLGVYERPWQGKNMRSAVRRQ